MDKAVLVSINWETEETMHSFVDGPHSIDKAYGLAESIKCDWPGWEHRVIGTPKAKEENAQLTVRRIFGDG